MRHPGVVLAVMALLAATPAGSTAQARVDPQLAGVWVAELPGSPLKMTFRIEASGRCSLEEAAGTCLAQAGILIYRSADGDVSRYAYQIQGDRLTVTGGDLAQALVFQRLRAPATEPAGKLEGRTPQPVARPPGPGGQGPRYDQQEWGVSFAIPPSWRVVDRKEALLMGSDSEAGLMMVRFVRQTNRQALSQDYSEGFAEEGVRLAPAGAAKDFAAGSYGGLAGELAGVGSDGSKLRARIIAVLSPYGDAAVFMGLTTSEKYEQLRPRVDTLAATVSFSKPRVPPANLAIAGQYYYIYASSIGGTYSREDTLNLCSNGLFHRAGESYSARAGEYGAAGQSGYSGQWSAEGDQNQGVVNLSYYNGRTVRVRYQRAGQDVIFDGNKYARFGDGSCSRKSPF